MAPILQTTIPDDMLQTRALPGIQPVSGSWLRVDEAYGAQMQERERLISERPKDVLFLDPNAAPAAKELLDAVLEEGAAHGFDGTSHVRCPDGRSVEIDRAEPMATLGRLVQCDLCILEKSDNEHVLTGAVLCFPASWRLSEKAGRPLTDIHIPVEEYDPALAKRVQRLFDGVQPGRALWRFNALWYEDPALFQPRSTVTPRPASDRNTAPYYRSERQTIFRLPETRAVVFAIHTLVLERESALQAFACNALHDHSVSG